MADTYLNRGAADTKTIATTYQGSGSRWEVEAGCRGVTVEIADGSVGFTVQWTPTEGSVEDAVERHRDAGGIFTKELAIGRGGTLDVKADAGTPDVSIGTW